ncbi:MAG TPA: hypothetical protein DEO67_10390 [Candidatus Edwardsbacteria bacterium]|nr:hypothetical protein [Candidatus Edwardsbacteria bacterium]
MEELLIRLSSLPGVTGSFFVGDDSSFVSQSLSSSFVQENAKRAVMVLAQTFEALSQVAQFKINRMMVNTGGSRLFIRRSDKGFLNLLTDITADVSVIDSALDGALKEMLIMAQQPAPAPVPEQAQPAPEISANENIRKALDIVKSYKLAGGRGTIESWFANAFLSGGAGGSNEEWTATPLHGDILVVQYRLLRPRQDPLIYQFEVDAAKQDIVRGINNNAIELLDFSSKEKSASAAPAKKAARPKARKPAKSREVPILPLPDAPAAGGSEQDPTGFENPSADSSEQVKYLKAQESDEELF